MADRDYCYIHFNTGKKLMVGSALKELEAMLPESWFIRVHRSYIINSKKITGIKKTNLEIGSTGIPIGASYRQSLFNKLQNFLK